MSLEGGWKKPAECYLCWCVDVFAERSLWTILLGAQAEQVGEHLDGLSTLFIFEYSCYPEAKILSGTEIRAIYADIKSWSRVANLIGSSEAFARQNSRKNKA